MMTQKVHIGTIPEFHKMAGLSQPPDASLSVVKLENILWRPVGEKTAIIRDFYIIAWKKDINTAFKYGQQEMYGKDAFLHFMAPRQLLTIDKSAGEMTNNGWLLLIHRDFLWNTSLAKKIRQYEYFSYEFNQILPLNADEETTITAIFRQIEHEQHQLKASNTKDIIVAQVELLLAYADRYYQTRKSRLNEKHEHSVLAQLERLIDDYFKGDGLLLKGVPTINYLSDRLHISPGHLSRLIQSLTGQTTQYLLHDKLIALAKEKISTTSSSISEIAYQLGFKSPQSFCRLFKVKTNQTPTEFRNAF